jgi:hypothetical protein
MEMPVPQAPPPGSAQAGDLYVDLQTRTLWLGVDTAVDASGFVLISDILAIQAEIDGCLAEAKAYTDAQVATRALINHTHTASQIVDFEAAVDAAVANNPGGGGGVVKGMIMMWSGSIAEIGVGALAGWALCDGGGTPPRPDLRDRFIIGAGNKLPGDKNPLTVVKTDVQGAHVHIITGTALTEAMLAPHAHYGEIHSRQYGATYGGGGSHQHNIYGPMWTGSWLEHDQSSEGDLGVNNGGVTHLTPGGQGAHEHNCYVDIHVGVTMDTRGSGATHTHSESTAGSHDHSLTSTQVRDVLPFYALAYIIKT